MPRVALAGKARSSDQRRICKNAKPPYRYQVAHQAKRQRTSPPERGKANPKYAHPALVSHQDKHRLAPTPTSSLCNSAQTAHHHSAGHNHPEEDRSARPESQRTQHLKLAAISTIIRWCLYSRRHFPHQDWQAQKTWQQHRLALATSAQVPVRCIACVISQYRQPGKTAFRQYQGCLLSVRPDQALSEPQPAFRP